MRTVLPLVLLLLVGVPGLSGVPGFAPAPAMAQEGERPASFRRYLFAGVGAVAFGGLAYIAAPDREGVLCAGKTCTAATAAAVGGTIGFLLGKDFDERAATRALGGPRLTAVPSIAALTDVPHALAELPAGIVALEDGGATLVDPALRPVSLLRGPRARAAVDWAGNDRVLIAADSFVLAIRVRDPPAAGTAADTIYHQGGTAAAATPEGGLLLGSRGNLLRIDLPPMPGGGPGREAQSVSLPGLPQNLVAEGGLLWVLADSVLEARDPSSLEQRTRLTLPGPGRDLTIAGGRAAIALGTGGVLLLDLTPPGGPTVLAHIDPVAVVFGVALTDERLYVAVGGDGLQVYDLSPVNAPRLLGTQREAGLAVDVVAREDWVLVLDRMGRRILRYEAEALTPGTPRRR